MLHIFWNTCTFIFALTVLITVHEFGHFCIARRCGVTVERFSIGFGSALWRWRDKYSTEYVIATIPLGGYVKMLDERLGTVSPNFRHKAFNHKSILQRTAIIAAGPIFNLLFAIFLYWLVFLIGVPSYRPVIGDIVPNSIADQANISPGMEIKSIDYTETPDWHSVRLQLIQKLGHDKIIFNVAPFGSMKSEQKILNLRNLQFELKKQDAIIALGIVPLHPRIEPVIIKIQQGSAAMKAGLQPGDKIFKVDDQKITTGQLFIDKVRNNPGRLLRVNVERKGSTLDIVLRPDSKFSNGEEKGFVGVVLQTVPFPVEYKTMQQYGLLPALIQAGEKTWKLIQFTINMLGKLLIGDVKLNNLSGPIAIAQGAGMSAEYGLIYYLMFLALISINLGIINLLPFPVLDGGHLLFLAIEKLRGKPIPERLQDLSYRIGSILLMLLMGLAIFNDFSRL